MYDGESRYIFNPDAYALDFGVRRVLQIPVVLGHMAAHDNQRADSEDEAEKTKTRSVFRFIGNPDEVEATKQRLLSWSSGDLLADMRATQSVIEKLQARSLSIRYEWGFG